jgi:hypothetical protein
MSRAIAAIVARGCGLAAALATGCLSVPRYEPEVSVSFRENGTGGTLAGPGFALRFADGDGFHFPDELAVDGRDVLGHDPAAGCFAPDEAGLLISPTPRISAHSEAAALVNRLVPVLRGPAVAQVTLEWATRLGCNSARDPHGVSTFTVFPDGRIVRHDNLVDSSSSEISASTCACGTGEGSLAFSVSAFWTFAKEPFRSLLPFVPGRLPGPTDPTITNLRSACLDGEAFQIAIAWPDRALTATRSSDTLVRFERSMVIGASRLDAYTWDDSTAIFIDRNPGCAAAMTRATAHLEPKPLTVNGVVAMPGALDAIYGSGGIALDRDRVELTGTIEGSFAVWLQFPRPVEELRVTLEGATGPWYVPQQVNDREWIVWFKDPISPPQIIAIEPR